MQLASLSPLTRSQTVPTYMHCKTSPTAALPTTAACCGPSSGWPPNCGPNLGDVASDDDRGTLRELARFLVGPAEIAELLGVEANTINVWKVRHANFPDPIRRLRSGDLWDVREIMAWARATGRRN